MQLTALVHLKPTIWFVSKLYLFCTFGVSFHSQALVILISLLCSLLLKRESLASLLFFFLSNFLSFNVQYFGISCLSTIDILTCHPRKSTGVNNESFHTDLPRPSQLMSWVVLKMDVKTSIYFMGLRKILQLYSKFFFNYKLWSLVPKSIHLNRSCRFYSNQQS